MSNIIIDENGMRSTVYDSEDRVNTDLIIDKIIYDSIELPNKGMIYLDSKAYDVLEGSEVSTDKKKSKWKTTITFTNNNIEYATIDETTKREYR